MGNLIKVFSAKKPNSCSYFFCARHEWCFASSSVDVQVCQMVLWSHFLLQSKENSQGKMEAFLKYMTAEIQKTDPNTAWTNTQKIAILAQNLSNRPTIFGETSEWKTHWYEKKCWIPALDKTQENMSSIWCLYMYVFWLSNLGKLWKVV